MNEPVGTPMPAAPKKNNTIIIVAIVAVILCCCCVIGGYVMYAYLGDPIMQALGLQ